MEKKKLFCLVSDLSVKYLKPLHSLEDITILVSIDSFSKVRFRLNYEILRNEESIALGKTSHCFVNGSFKVIPIPNELFIQL